MKCSRYTIILLSIIYKLNNVQIIVFNDNNNCLLPTGECVYLSEPRLSEFEDCRLTKGIDEGYICMFIF